jgi:hypothetical protein
MLCGGCGPVLCPRADFSDFPRHDILPGVERKRIEQLIGSSSDSRERTLSGFASSSHASAPSSLRSAPSSLRSVYVLTTDSLAMPRTVSPLYGPPHQQLPDSTFGIKASSIPDSGSSAAHYDHAVSQGRPLRTATATPLLRCPPPRPAALITSPT